MYKIFKADKDSYITNRIIKIAAINSERTGSNVGDAGSLDLFKLYGTTFSNLDEPNTELSRILIHFDISELKDMFSLGKININSNTFVCTLNLFDVYGGQTTPSNFDISVYPLSRSFDEGSGRDVVYYSDYDSCNFLSSSILNSWLSPGCLKSGEQEISCDYITSSLSLGISSFESKQHFNSGEENLVIDVTTVISATLINVLPDSGFRISLDPKLENDQYSYFVKRFASRSAYDVSKRPRLIVKYDDSIQDDTQNLRFDESSNLFMRNYYHDELSNIINNSSEISGSNCLLLKLTTTLSNWSGTYDIFFTGSQYSDGLNYFNGTYKADFIIPQSNVLLNQELIKSGSVVFIPTWCSLDNTIGYLTGSKITVYPPLRTSNVISFKNYVVTTSGLQQVHRTNEDIFIRLNIFDYGSPYIKLVKNPIDLPGIVVRKAFYQVRNVETNEIVIPFDDIKMSTKLSSDSQGMYFTLNAQSLIPEKSYTIDIMLSIGGLKKVYKSVSNVFSVSDTLIG